MTKDLSDQLASSLKSLSLSFSARFGHLNHTDAYHHLPATPSNMLLTSPRSFGSINNDSFLIASDKLEKQFCRDFVCCDTDLEDLHHLLKHIEEVHHRTSTPALPTLNPDLFAHLQQDTLFECEDSDSSLPAMATAPLISTTTLFSVPPFKNISLSPINEESSVNSSFSFASLPMSNPTSILLENNQMSTADHPLGLPLTDDVVLSKNVALPLSDIYRPVQLETELTDVDNMSEDDEEEDDDEFMFTPKRANSTSNLSLARKRSNSTSSAVDVTISLKRRMPYKKKTPPVSSKKTKLPSGTSSAKTSSDELNTADDMTDTTAVVSPMIPIGAPDSSSRKTLGRRRLSAPTKPPGLTASTVSPLHQQSVPDLTSTSQVSSGSLSDHSDDSSIIDIIKEDKKATASPVQFADPILSEEANNLKKYPKSCNLSIVDPATGERKYICAVPTCKKQYKNANGLKYHLQHAHPDGVGVPEAFMEAQKIRDAHDYRPYQCSLAGCGKRYKNLNGLKYHIEHAHNAILPPAANVVDPNGPHDLHGKFLPPHPALWPHGFIPMFPFPPMPSGVSVPSPNMIPDMMHFFNQLSPQQQQHLLAMGMVPMIRDPTATQPTIPE